MADGGAIPDAGPPPVGTCDEPTAITFVHGSYDVAGFLVGDSSTDTPCNSYAGTGPDRVFSFELTSPAYLFAVQRGNATSSPMLKLHDGTCTDPPARCTYGGGISAPASRNPHA